MPVKLFGKLAQQLFQVIDTETENINLSHYLERYGFGAITAAGFGMYKWLYEYATKL